MTTWHSQNHDEPRDQEIDLGDGWWAACGPSYEGGWTWDLYDQWVVDDLNATVAEGNAATETEAKQAALDAYRRLREVQS